MPGRTVNFGLLMRHVVGVGHPRRLQGAVAAALAVVQGLWRAMVDLVHVYITQGRPESTSALRRPPLCRTATSPASR
jgi:hypothetical protein